MSCSTHLIIVVRHLEDNVIVDIDVEYVVVLFTLEDSLSGAHSVAALVGVSDHVANLTPLTGNLKLILS